MSALPAILIVEDEPILAKNMSRYLQHAEFEVEIANSGGTALEALENYKPDIVLLDYRLPDTNGVELLRKIRQIDSRIRVIMITGEGNVTIAVEAMKTGASDYVTKPVILSELKLLLTKISDDERREGALNYFRQKQAVESGLDKMLGKSAVMVDLREKISSLLEAEKNLVDGVPASVLITGETGSGKDLVARAFHFGGSRSDGPFIDLNCSAIPGHLLEAELFGYERGAFTDAKERKIGLVESADGGTLFLDEIGDMESALQTKLLKLLEHRQLRRLGGLRDQRVDVRIVAATNRDLSRMMAEGTFRSDLFYRLQVIQIEVPPLRERGMDIIYLADHMLEQHAQRYRREKIVISDEARSKLWSYSWPGKVRALRNVMEQMVLMNTTGVLEPHHLPLNQTVLVEKNGDSDFDSVLAFNRGLDTLNIVDMEQRLVTEALKRTEGNVTRAAELLGLSRDTLRYRMEKYRISVNG